ncbi:MAG: glycoside hydrolase family 127 protein [Lentisphaerae bacterium]|nr:glycoside hydrolase family 127 protein [Lentisphaerota bacterium]MBT4816084.1 glycoside hydrolase family 127 protein [Lentisphaerota bacterium]MBT5606241.1 glycoside hydrolase family 127 protein [Lentisphaerota bacterium]MBT7054068.1 glycoside hydrolase family 127 protein [Lentisphaerota bacterium]MBT7845107.1 glycoside hydrolase family 127 protein [Lentisphaerota bacterium]
MSTSRPIPLESTRITGGFWQARIDVNRDVTLPLQHRHCKDTGRLDAFAWEDGKPNQPHHFWESDCAKWIEAAAYSLVHNPDPELEAQVDAYAELLAESQCADGYLNSFYQRVRPNKRWTNLRDMHELYCAGHLMEGAVAYHEATGKRTLLDVLSRYADHIARMFGPEEGKRRGYPGHEEIELALVKLYHATGNVKHLALAAFFVNERGTQPHYFDDEAKARGDEPRTYHHGNYDYTQAHLPVRRQKTAEGHSVRACYLYAGMASVAAETEDEELFAACRRIWDNITQRRMYIHGGIGSSRFGERFSFDYDLPNEDAYAETCAAIALVFFAHRMLQIEPDSRYADVMERALYNGVISGVSLDGKRFFYDNFLASHPPYQRFNGQKSPERQEWFGCACCPPNLARLLASLNGYLYTQTDDAIWTHLYGTSEVTTKLANTPVTLTQTTDYPWDGDVVVEVAPERPATFTIALRKPAWCHEATVTVKGETVEGPDESGYIALRREWQQGDRIVLTLAMPVERIEAHPSVRHDAGRVALQRGPILYCLEEADNGKDLYDVLLPTDAELTAATSGSPFEGVPIITGPAKRRDTATWSDQLYRPAGTPLVETEITAIPYFLWANRGIGEMITWIQGR